MSYTINITGHATNATPEEIEAEARKFVAALDGVSSAILHDARGATGLREES